MKIKTKSIYKGLLLFSIIYVYTKALWDTYLGSPAKLLFYGTVFGGVLMYTVQTIISQRKTDLLILLGFISYGLYILYNGKTHSNSEQFSQGMLEYILYTYYFLACIFYVRKSNFKLTDFKALIYLGEILSLMAVFEYTTQKAIIAVTDYTIYYFEGGYSSFRAKVFCISPMTMCMMFGLLFLVSIELYYIEKIRCTGLLKISPFLFLVGMFCTGSRGPLIGTLCGGLLMYGLNWISNPITKNKGIRAICIFFIVLAFFMWTQFIGGISDFRTGIDLIDNIIKRFSSATDFANEWGNVARLRIWTKYIAIFKLNFENGIGIAQTSSTVASNTYGVTESGLLKRLVETGFCGMLFYIVGILFPLFYGIYKNVIQPNDNKKWHFIIAVMVAVLIEDIILQLFADVMVMYVFWTLVAVVYASNYNEKQPLKRCLLKD